MELSKELTSVIKILVELLPNKIRAIYLIGSFAENYNIKTSDIDAEIILKSTATKKDLEKVDRIIENLAQLCSIDLDMSVLNEKVLFKPKTNIEKRDALVIKHSSTLAFGEDIKNKIPETDFASYLKMALDRAVHFILRVRGLKKLEESLTYPKPNDFYFGYCDREILFNHVDTLSSKELVVNMGWIANALIALKAKEIVLSKNKCLPKYQALINDEWTPFLEDIFLLCRKKWNYLLPESLEDKNKLRELCKKALEFEKYYLVEYHKQYSKQINKKVID